MITSRERVMRTLEFKNEGRAPRHLWTLPWASMVHGELLNQIRMDFPDDIVTFPMNGITTAEGFSKRPDDLEGDPYEPGTYLDVWGCRFLNKHRGVIGEIKEAMIKDDEWEDGSLVKMPEVVLQLDKEQINAYCRSTDKFVLAGDWARPFERLQFLRGTEQLYMDLALRPDNMKEVIDRVNDFYCRLITAWCETDVDAVWFMDDWGSQRSLLISPALWIEYFKPMYTDYVEIAHRHGKKIFMHSDGYIHEILPHLIEIGVDAINSQIFCMGLETMVQYKGKITFWGEIDRQHLLPHGSTEDIDAAVKLVYDTLWENGGCIAQCEFGPGAKPENVRRTFEAWDEITGQD